MFVSPLLSEQNLSHHLSGLTHELSGSQSSPLTHTRQLTHNAQGHKGRQHMFDCIWASLAGRGEL